MARVKSRRVRRDDIVSNMRDTQEKIEEYAGVLQALDLPLSDAQKKAGEDGLAEIESAVDDAKSGLEELMEEIQAWRDNLPDALSNGDKAQALEDCVTQLQGAIDALEGCNFPGWQEEPDEAEIDTLCDELEAIGTEIDTACDEAESAEFPGMFG